MNIFDQRPTRRHGLLRHFPVDNGAASQPLAPAREHIRGLFGIADRDFRPWPLSTRHAGPEIRTQDGAPDHPALRGLLGRGRASRLPQSFFSSF